MSGHGHADTDTDTDTVAAMTVSTAAAARLAGVSPRTIRRWVAQGWLPSSAGANGQVVSPADLPAAARLAREKRGHGHASADTSADTDTDTAMTAPDRGAEAEAVIRRIIAPFVAEQTRLAEELGRVKAERDELRRRAEAAEAALSAYRAQMDAANSGQARVSASGDEPQIATPADTPDAPAPAGGVWGRVRGWWRG